MQKIRGQMRRKRSEADVFRTRLMMLRRELGWTQDTLGIKLGVSRRTVSNWENGYWLPPSKQRLHVVLALREAPPEYVLAIADALGLSTDPAIAPLLEQFEETDDDEAVAPAPQPARPRPTPEQLRAAMDAVVRETADSLDARPNDVRAAIMRALAACEALGANLEETRAAAAAAAAPKPKR